MLAASKGVPPTSMLWTDASLEGWGGHDQEGNWVAGSWGELDRHLHINLLELKAVKLSLDSQLVAPNSSIRLFSDNVTTIRALANRGSTKSLPVTLLVEEILQLCWRKSIQIHPHQIPGKLNVLADALSRNSTIPGEWELHPKDRVMLLSQFPKLQVDLMSTPFNYLLKPFVSPFQHPQAAAVDAWAQDWNQWSFIYLFLPKVKLLRFSIV